jgi:ParB-like chromosome segregation protein Spo0J
MSTPQNRPQRKDLFYIPFNQLKIDKEWNARIDYGNIDELANQILSVGEIRMPLRGMKDKDGFYVVRDGHRRYLATKLLVDKKKLNGDEFLMPFLTYGREYSEIAALKDTLICAEGKPLNPVEQAIVIHRLMEEGLSEKDICENTGFTNVYVSNLKLLYNAPKKIHTLILDNVISATLAMKILRETKDFDEAVDTIEEAISFKESTDNKRKITERDVRKSKKKVNSISAMRKAYKKYERAECVVRQDKIELFTFIKSVMEGQLSFDELMSELYEPIAEKEKQQRGRKKMAEIEAE